MKRTRHKRVPSPRRRALEFIAAHPDGCTEALLAAENIPADILIELEWSPGAASKSSEDHTARTPTRRYPLGYGGHDWILPYLYTEFLWFPHGSRFPAGHFFCRLGDPHPHRLDSPIFVLEAFVPCDHQAALYQSHCKFKTRPVKPG